MTQTNNQRFHDLTFTLMDDGTVKLTQTDCGEDFVVVAHPEQIRFIARRVCGLNEATAAKVSDLERKLSVITDRLESLVTADWLRKSIANECEDGIEIMAKLDGLLDLAVEMDGGRLLPSDPKPAPKKNKFEPSKPPANFQQADLLNG